MTPRATLVIPAYNEGDSIREVLDLVLDTVTSEMEILVVYDSPEDTTAAPARDYSRNEPKVRPTLNMYGPGPANALRFGVDHAKAPVTVVMMADGSDDPSQIDQMIRLVEEGAVVVAASRYVRGGRQLGGPPVKRTLSRLAGITLHTVGRVGTHDATNSFKAYSTEFLRSVGIASRHGFEMGIELVAKARRARLRVDEIPTTWRDRDQGESRFRIARWIPHYLKWYLFAFGPRLEPEAIRARTTRR